MYDLESMSAAEMKKIIEEAPKVEPITGYVRCNAYMFHEGVVYLPNPAYDAYTLPTYDEEDGSFSWTRIDMDDDFRREHEVLCYLDDLRDREDFEEIKKFYGVEYDPVVAQEIIDSVMENLKANK
ncbi:hypothetical protein [Cellulosilyticum sp. WCF-2]|uniref:hypothetical protein n=1 Tax=Cellulosilyticum sp. WCF-2 TaxID=2497860 RepID=UPI000F8F1BFB|nr:hypothetical protein [Cellulosilyticum sp. WCF-2]QEH69936.1 hypothetical protein EKH84_16655 [Cellulosilyticum sp. WCF-2]